MDNIYVVEYEEYCYGETDSEVVGYFTTKEKAVAGVKAYFEKHIRPKEPNSYFDPCGDLDAIDGFIVRGTYGRIHRHFSIFEYPVDE